MRNVPCVAWMLGFYPASELGDYLAFLANGSVAEHFSAGVKGAAAFVMIAFWIAGAVWLHEGRQ